MISTIQSTIHWEELGPALGGIATFVVALVIPAFWLFHHKVIKPLSFVLGLKQEDSPTGEAIPSIPVQLAQLRADGVKRTSELSKLSVELHPNGGATLRDAIDRSEKGVAKVQVQVVDLDNLLQSHVVQEAQARSDLAVLVSKTASEVAALAVLTAKDVKTTAEANASSVARLATDTASDVKATAEHQAEDVAKLAVDTALILKHKDDA
jgi:hypothetical protein